MAVPLRTDDLLIPQGASWEVRWPINNPDGTPTDLTSWTIRAQVRESVSSAVVLHEWTTALGNAMNVTNSVALTVDPAVSSAWTWTAGVFDVELVNVDGRVWRVTQGTIRVDPEVTR